MTETSWPPGPARPRLDADAVDVWLVALDDAPDELPLRAHERERAARFVDAAVGRRWAVGRATLRRLLAAYADADPGALRFAEGPHGKPRLVQPARLRFNLSHSAGTALIAVAADREVGVDVELPRRSTDHVAIARRVLAADEAARIEAIADARERERAFLRAWVRWEADLKCRGTGIGAAGTAAAGSGGGASGERLPWVAELDVPPPAVAALAVADGPAAVRTWRWPAAAA